jgi:hypothetical protein
MRSKFYAFIAVLGLAGASASAALVATDNASNYSGGGWGTTPPNLGSGWGPWNVVLTDANSPPYVGTYLGNGGGDAYAATQIGTAGYVWGTYSNNPDTTNSNRIDLYRTFQVNPTGYQDPSGLGTLYNQTFSVNLLTYGVGNGNGGPPNSALGFSLDTGTGATANPVFTFEYSGTNAGDSATVIDNDGTNNSSTPVNFAAFNSGLMVTVTVGSNPDGVNPYTLNVYNNSGSSLLYTYSNTTTGPIQQIDLFDANTTQNGYFNLPQVSAEAPVPEPATIGLLGAASLLLAARRRRI